MLRCALLTSVFVGLAGCTASPTSTTTDASSGLASSSSASSSRPRIAAIADPGCRQGEEGVKDRTVPSREVTLSLSLDAFGASPPAERARGAASWALSPTTLGSSCRTVGTSEPRVGFYRGGGFLQSFCSYEIGGRPIEDERELAAALAPIDSPRKALAMVALAQPIAYETELASPRPEKRVRMPEAVDTSTPAFDVARFDGGYVVRVPQEISCPRSVYRSSYRVAQDGALCRANEPSILIDVGDGTCVD